MRCSLRAVPQIVAAVWLSLVLGYANSQGKFDKSALGNLKGSGAQSIKVARSHAFVASIELGTPPQMLKCLVDSGSADLWVPSKRCHDCGGKNHFFADASSTFYPKLVQTPRGVVPKAYQVTYGSGSVTGFGVQDTFTFGSTQVKNQSFIIVEDQVLPPSMPWDGIFGLGWSGIAKVGKPVYQRMQEAQHPAIFALVPVQKNEASLTLGSVPQAQIKPNSLVWVNSEDIVLPSHPQGDNARTFWIVSGGVAVTRKEPRQEKFLVDTGTNQLLLVPTKHFSDFVRSLLPADSFDKHCGMDTMMGNLIVCDCAIGASGNDPPMRLYLGTRQFEIPIPELFSKVKATDGTELCLLEIQPNDVGPQGLDGVEGGILHDILSGVGPFGPPQQGAAPQGGMPFPGLIPAAPEEAPSSAGGNAGAQGSQPAFPFKIPGLGGLLRGMPNDMPKHMKPGEEVEEVIQRQPNGEVCTTQVITEPSGKQRKTRKCKKGGEAGALPALPRRLQGGVAILQPVPVQQQGGAMPIMVQPMGMPMQEVENPLADLWVLGGVFMEKFVTIFDFDNKRVGFAEPLNPVFRLQQTSESSYQARQASLPTDVAPPAPASLPAGGAPLAPAPAPAPLAPVQGAAAQQAKQTRRMEMSLVGKILIFGSLAVTALLVVRCAFNAPLPWNTRRNASPSHLDEELPGE